MATYGARVRRGLPRVPGGEPWPAATDAAAGARSGAGAPSAAGAHSGAGAGAPSAADAASLSGVGASVPQVRPEFEAPSADDGAIGPDAAGDAAARSSSAVDADGARALRRGLPRVPGGEPWPPASIASPAAVVAPASIGGAFVPQGRQESEAPSRSESAIAASPAAVPAAAVPAATGGAGGPAPALRRGLPRVPGGDPWPPASFVPRLPESAGASPADVAPADGASVPQGRQESDAPSLNEGAIAAAAPATVSPAGPLPFTPTVFATASSQRWSALRTERQGKGPVPAPEPARVGPFTRGQWAGAAIVGGLGLLFAAGMLVLAVRWLLSLSFLQDFLVTYPGEYHLPDTAPVGLPAWIGWQHFFNVFLMVLIIRSGLQVRREKRPAAFWSPRRNKKRKISLNLWFHQSLDILWLVNGVVFVVLLFVTGQWMRIVPTSWEVFPNALSAALQYVSLDWPTENGWVNYNALQQLAYFATVFVAAPLAAVTGVRMSGVWPKNATSLNKAYPVEWARAVHFPVMIYFVLFIVVHVTLVLATGALRNLNHMYAAQDAVNWAGFWIFAASLVVIAAGWVAARPLVLAPIARLFGTVSSR